jgi:hypothetical protein
MEENHRTDQKSENQKLKPPSVADMVPMTPAPTPSIGLTVPSSIRSIVQVITIPSLSLSLSLPDVSIARRFAIFLSQEESPSNVLLSCRVFAACH